MVVLKVCDDYMALEQNFKLLKHHGFEFLLPKMKNKHCPLFCPLKK